MTPWGLARLARFAVVESAAFRAWRLGRRFRGLTVHHSARIDAAGEFAYGPDVGIDERSVVTVEAGGRLALGDHCRIGRSVEIGAGTITVGDHTTIQDRAILLGEVAIGRYCRIAPNLYCSSGTHHWKRDPAALIMDQDEAARAERRADPASRVVIEDDCWIGINVVIMPGVVIGKGCVIGANAVVTKSVPPYSVAVGAPARVTRKRLDYRPPRTLDAARAEDLPYFHRGFALSAAERSRSPGGLVAEGAFALSLAAPEPSPSLEIVAGEPPGGGSAWIAHGGRSERLSVEPRAFVFPALIGAEGRYHGEVRDAAGAPARALIRSARLI